MKRMSYLLSVILIIVFFGGNSKCYADNGIELTILTEDYYPLNFMEAGEITGLSTEIVKEIMLRRGVDSEIKLVEWEEGYKMLLHEKNIALFTTGMNEERKDKFQWVGPLTVFVNSFYALKNSGIESSNLADFKKSGKISTVKGYHSEQLLQAAGFTNLVSSPNEEIALKRLLEGETTLFIGNSLALPELLQKVGADADILENLFTVSTNFAYIAFSKDTPSEIVDGWQQTLDEMKDDGVFAEIYSRWLPDDVPPGKLALVTEEYPPITFMKDGQPSGFVTDIVREIAARLNIPDNIQLTYWNNAYNMALLHPNVILFSAERTPERENLFHWVGPVGKNSSVLYARKGSGITIKKLKDAKKIKSIATTTDWFTEQYLKKEGFKNLVSSPDPVQNVRQLMEGEVQLSIFTDITIPEIMKRSGYLLDELEPVFTVEQTYFYIAISQGTPLEIVNSWQSSLNDLILDGTFEKIYRNYLPDADLRDLIK